MKRLALTVFVALLTFPFLAEAEYRCDKPVGKLALVSPRDITPRMLDIEESSNPVLFPKGLVVARITSSNCFELTDVLEEADYILIARSELAYLKTYEAFWVPVRELWATVSLSLQSIKTKSLIGSGLGQTAFRLEKAPGVEVYTEEVQKAFRDALDDLFNQTLSLLEAGIEPPQLSLSQ